MGRSLNRPELAWRDHVVAVFPPVGEERSDTYKSSPSSTEIFDYFSHYGEIIDIQVFTHKAKWKTVFVTFRQSYTVSSLMGKKGRLTIELKGAQRIPYFVIQTDIVRLDTLYRPPCAYSAIVSYKPSLPKGTSSKRPRSPSSSNLSNDPSLGPGPSKRPALLSTSRPTSLDQSHEQVPPSHSPPTTSRESVPNSSADSISPPKSAQTQSELPRSPRGVALIHNTTHETSQKRRRSIESRGVDPRRRTEVAIIIPMREGDDGMTSPGEITPASLQQLIHEMKEESNAANGRLYRFGGGARSPLESEHNSIPPKPPNADAGLIKLAEGQITEERAKRAAVQQKLDLFSREIADLDRRLGEEAKGCDDLERNLEEMTLLVEENNTLRTSLAGLESELDAENEACAKLAREGDELQAKLEESTSGDNSFTIPKTPLATADQSLSATSSFSSSSSLTTLPSPATPITPSFTIIPSPIEPKKLPPTMLNTLNLLDAISSSALLKIKAQRSGAAPSI